MDALVRQVEILSSSGPLLVIFEDAHWADPTSLELIGRLVHHIRGHRVLLVISFRLAGIRGAPGSSKRM